MKVLERQAPCTILRIPGYNPKNPHKNYAVIIFFYEKCIILF